MFAEQARHAQFPKEFFTICFYVAKSPILHRRKVCLHKNCMFSCTYTSDQLIKMKKKYRDLHEISSYSLATDRNFKINTVSLRETTRHDLISPHPTWQFFSKNTFIYFYGPHILLEIHSTFSK